MYVLDVEMEIIKKMFKEGIFWYCSDCSYKSGTKSNVYEHVEAKHVIHGGYQCQLCTSVAKTKGSLRVHYNKYHKQ